MSDHTQLVLLRTNNNHDRLACRLLAASSVSLLLATISAAYLVVVGFG